MSKLETPVAGRVLSVNVAVGARVAEGDTIATIESMKMELPVEAERAGTVAQVLIAVGDEVDEGQVLLELA
ncbi:acetyl-CoA carboxylase biotin carboxyl carrier protein subunit [Bordetella genomosp. 4]|uniref:Acetyl-CoA carboxylase biotin carboxyl carrier protein subunit n=1 Tax=Bordetella genomosp. 4 TaxID=463044 RepID=A0A261U9T5_9BORD|nr:acetyl-CoA carboxylase biotin carboxyl carrier protein subunit [Bordetella genomosp. 4]OZI51035.1 acetyl-CoA carboxylase biotin carboxyl carrier protein subunit [Bordetella genomosp. 4]OZI58355.1 acetyl-CoA carboxylase biotin carboxyl carrier protein subunit [Bordetella genomosp. 4]